MTKKTRNLTWILLLVAGLVCLGFYWFSQWRQEQESRKSDETNALSEERQGRAGEEKVPLPDATTEAEPPEKNILEADPCARAEENVAEFFRYLDRQTYIRRMGLETDTYTCFKDILKKLSAKPPVPAGEGTDPEIIIQNVCYFFRILKSNDLRLIKETIQNETDSLELDLELFYEWLMLGNSCSDPEGLRPPLGVLYRYAGFFINTTGGRAYLFRRSSSLRLLVSYYCILIIHEADKTGTNSYGIDIAPIIPPLRQEVGRYSEFKFQQLYLDRLNLIESYYIMKRS